MTDKPKPPCRDNYRQLSIYVSHTMLARLTTVLEKDRRNSMNNLINSLLEDGIAAFWTRWGTPEPLPTNAPKDDTEPDQIPE